MRRFDEHPPKGRWGARGERREKRGNQVGGVALNPAADKIRLRFYNPDVDQPWIKRIA